MNGFWFLVSGFRLPARGRLAIRVLPSAFCILLSGCTSRGLTITSEPPGAEVSINHEIVGIAPVHVGYTHYGTYHIELRKEGYATITRDESIPPRVWGYDPLALAADNAIPLRLNDDLYLHYALQPQEPAGSRTELLQRAELARDGEVTNPRTGVQVQVVYTSPSKGRPYTEQPAEGAPGAEGGAGQAKAQTSAVPPELKEIQPITATPPEGMRLSKELGIEPAPQKPAETKTPGAAPPRRTPKNEELIYSHP